jgi:hypothetical protein
LSAPRRRVAPRSPGAGDPRVGQGDDAYLAHHLEAGAVGEDEAAVELAEHAVGQGERPGEGDVDPTAAEHLLAPRTLGLAGQQPDPAQAVAADASSAS